MTLKRFTVIITLLGVIAFSPVPGYAGQTPQGGVQHMQVRGSSFDTGRMVRSRVRQRVRLMIQDAEEHPAARLHERSAPQPHAPETSE